MRWVFWAGFATFLADQISKYLVVHLLDLKRLGEIDVIPPYLNFRMAWNEGINFGILDVSRWFLIALAIGISTWVLVWVYKEGKTQIAYLSAGILVGGALGNVLDRLLYGAVADFLNMSCCGIENPYAFNVADIAIFAGALGLVIFTGEKKPRDAP
ncbi:signal peptidase II [Pseudohalocynthiibacter aestuariivivens]|jgi:signal peptidase II|uniref:Lipoprotein signal peptidase n=1 Tax=Pseudohalocynthiibacter aestuariivivens TaxID=1591409 RepID=A0ABV5JF91_9RHOB|nr:MULTISPECIES: signal peptidase II [Pseudohalocynthiibacter]MBS9717963.1 signal peptidase II [Pseudohalocynthiibacter aestuariivivens]MCK0103135.1 signal peptidase II [Pseudohalocynthiibacter sp. F2068]